MLLSIIIVNYNTEKEIAECLYSIAKQTLFDIEVIVVDNSSSFIIEETYSLSVKVINPNENLGFGRANNLGVDSASGEFILFLNPDCQLLSQDSLMGLVDRIKHDTAIGLLAPAIIENNHITLPSNNYPKQKYLPQNYFDNLSGDIAWVLGATMLVRKNEFVKLGGFDKDFFMYGEETDLCLRYRKAGFSVEYMESIIVNHIGGASEVNAKAYDYWLRKQRGLYLFLDKHYPIKVFRTIIASEQKSSLLKLSLARIKIFLGIGNIKLQSDYDRYKAIYDSAVKTMACTKWLYFKD